LRQYLFRSSRLKHVHIFDSRTKAFSRDKVLQETVIFRANYLLGTETKITVSNGVEDILDAVPNTYNISDLVDLNSNDQVLHLPRDRDDFRLITKMKKLKYRLASHNIKVSTGRVVAFRSLPFLQKKESVNTVPLLWLNNVLPMNLKWPVEVEGKPQYISLDAGTLLIPKNNYIIQRRFSSKEDQRRLVCTPVYAEQLKADYLGVENKLNFFYRIGGDFNKEEVKGLALLLNSKLYDDYFRLINGNVNVSATEMNIMPLPSLATIAAIGLNATPELDEYELEELIDTYLFPVTIAA
jgi:adenine-specific DNA-methyltransferase